MQVVTALLTHAAVFAQLEVHGDEAGTKMMLFLADFVYTVQHLCT